MNTTATRAALARLQALPWADYATRTTEGLRLCWAVAQLLAMAATIAAETAWQHRQQIRSAFVTAAAAAILAAELTYQAGCRARRWWAALLDASERLGRWYAALLVPATPEPAPVPVIDLASLSNRELRELLGVRRRLSKRQLLELAAAS